MTAKRKAAAPTQGTCAAPPGESAKSIWAHLCCGSPQNGDYPTDSDDFARCEAFLNENPDLFLNFSRMAEVNAYWAALVPQWQALRDTHADGRTAIIKGIVGPIEQIDPGCANIGTMSMREVAPITFQMPPPADPPAPSATAADQLDKDRFEAAVHAVWAKGKASTSFIQRKLGIGYNAAARLIERMEAMAIVSQPDDVGKRIVRTPEDLRATLAVRDQIMDIAGDQLGPAVLKAIAEELRKAPPAEFINAAETMARKGRAPMAEDKDFKKHNQVAYSVTADELRQFIERYEQLEAEKKDVTGQQKELMGEATGRGYDTKVMRKVIALRKRKPDEIAEEEAVLEMYKTALGMA